MTTVAQVAKASLQRILVQGSEADLEPDEYQDFIFAMNNYMASLEADGICLGYSPVADLGDEVTIPEGAIRGLIANMAIEVSPDYNGQITPGLIAAADAGLKAMRKLGQLSKQTKLPGNLPRGSGNRDHRSNRFYK